MKCVNARVRGMVKLAHMTDVHLPLPGATPLELASKRVLGWLSWRLRRARAHRPEALRAVLADVRAHAPDHVVITGDVVNISSRREFAAARRWLEETTRMLGPLTLVPGNHDLYVAAARQGLRELAEWMPGKAGADGMPLFPAVRVVRDVALIGLNSAFPAPWGEASGALGTAQIERLRGVLADCAAKGLCRVVLVHHPPLPELERRERKALRDAPVLEEVLRENGVELVLFGHTHRWAHKELRTRHGVAHILSAPSASMRAGLEDKVPAAGWQLVSITREQGEWRLEVLQRALLANGKLARRAHLRLACGVAPVAAATTD